MFDPFTFATNAAGSGGFSFSSPKDIRPTATQLGDLSGGTINFGSSAPGITTGQIAILTGGVLVGLWLVKEFG